MPAKSSQIAGSPRDGGHRSRWQPAPHYTKSGRARALLDNLAPSRARSGVRRTLSRAELEEHLDEIARVHGSSALNELRDDGRATARKLGADARFAELDALLGALQGTRDAPVASRVARARQHR